MAVVTAAIASAVSGLFAFTLLGHDLDRSAVLVWRRPDRSADRLVVRETREGGYVDAIARWIFRGRTGQGEVLAHLVRGDQMIAGGVGIAAAGGVLSFVGDTVGHAIGFTSGVVEMDGGSVRTTRPIASRAIRDQAGPEPDGSLA